MGQYHFWAISTAVPRSDARGKHPKIFLDNCHSIKKTQNNNLSVFKESKKKFHSVKTKKMRNYSSPLPPSKINTKDNHNNWQRLSKNKPISTTLLPPCSPLPARIGPQKEDSKSLQLRPIDSQFIKRGPAIKKWQRN